jgi:hypothetical protein
MTAFEVFLNGQRLCLAGVADGVVTVIANAVDSRGERWVSVGGLEGDSHLGWVDETPLKSGDELRIRVVESDHVDAPVRTRRDDVRLIEAAERREYDRLKQKFG